MQTSARSSRGIEPGLQRQRGKQDETGIAVRLEHREADVGIIDLEPGDLPSQMHGEQDKPRGRYGAAAGRPLRAAAVTAGLATASRRCSGEDWTAGIGSVEKMR